MEYFSLYVLGEQICGKALQGIDCADLKDMGVKMGRRILLMNEIEHLVGCRSTITGKNEN